MIKSAVMFLGYGFLWLIIFSFPLTPKIQVYDVAYGYIIHTRPVHWLTDFAKSMFDKSHQKTQSIFENFEEYLTENSRK